MNLFNKYIKSQNLEERFLNYQKMIENVFVDCYSIWDKEKVFAEVKNGSIESKDSALEWWKDLIK